MAVLITSRAKLDTALGVETNRVMVLIGDREGVAGEIHDFMEGRDDLKEEVFRKWFLVTDPSILTATELTDWFGGADEGYVVLRDEPKEISADGPLDDLLRNDGKPSILRIRREFSRRVGAGT